jgi:hypothetical protein
MDDRMRLIAKVKRDAASVNRKEKGFGELAADTSVETISTLVCRLAQHWCAGREIGSVKQVRERVEVRRC